MIKVLISFSLLSVYFMTVQLNAQCTPPSADECDQANVLCSLSEVNGYCCQNTDYSNPTGCSPLCPSGGAPHNTGWWAFVTQGGTVNITITFSNCTVNGTGVQMGIWGDCTCGESIVCNPGCSGPGSYTLSGNLIPCKIYYLFVDGCSGDVCDFCLATTGGLPPMLPPLGNITGPREVCIGACKTKYTVDVAGACEPVYEWTLDGNEVGNGTGEVTLDFPQEGDFILCVTAYIGNPRSGSICDQEGPVCITIKVRPERDRVGPPWNLCSEDLPFDWHGISVAKSGEYRQTFRDWNGCCVFDSVREFIIKPVPDTAIIFHLGCSAADGYLDTIANQYFFSCQYQKLITLKNSTNPLLCDSAYLLNAVFLNYNTIFREFCDSGYLHIDARVIDRTITCGNDSDLMRSVRYRWYLNSDSTKTTIDTQSYLLIDQKDVYCLEILIYAEFGDQKKMCSFSFCEQWDESEFLPYQVCILGNFEAKNGDSAHYSIDTIPEDSVRQQIWTVEGGKILTRDEGKDTSDVLVLWDDTSSVRMICYQYSNECGLSKKCCREVRFISSLDEAILKPEDIILVPNPVSHSFRIIIKENLKIKSLQLFDLQGRPIQTWTQNFSEEFDLSEFTNGIYHVRIHAEQGTIHKKIVFIK
ncbi:MAG: T9SS type A sorting domain-containing protein [Saprospiraceae bacterium]|nr:T9SS type A sorting domain-containing protein [Saprospiraceae bacterium]